MDLPDDATDSFLSPYSLCPDSETTADCDPLENWESQIMELNNLLSVINESDLCLESRRMQSCEQSYFHIVLLGYCFPFTLTMCIVGNVLNVVTYAEKSLRKSTTVKMLTVKAIMNTMFMMCLLPHFFLLTMGREASEDKQFEKYLWSSWPYTLFVANIAGTSATWITVLSTLERYVYVAWPMQSKKWCTTRNLTRILIVVILAAVVVHLQIPITRYVESVPCGDDNKVVHQMYVRNGTVYFWSESIYYWMNFSCALLIPSILAVLLTIRLTDKLMHSPLPNYTERKRCVTRITMATTICQLTLETPAVGVYAVAALYGPTFINENRVMCTCHVLINYANQLNASMCFFIYLLCSAKFRQLLLRRLKPFLCFRVIHVGSVNGTAETIIRSQLGSILEMRRLTDDYTATNEQ